MIKIIDINYSRIKKSLIVGLIVGIIGFIISLDILAAFGIFLISSSVAGIFFWIKDIVKKQGQELERKYKIIK